MRRIWLGVAATARISAISRSRCWIDRPSVLATTNIAINIASPPNAAVTGIKMVRVRSSCGYSAAPRASPVSTCAPLTAALLQPWATAALSPSRAGTDTSPIAARTPGTAASRAASAELTRARSPSRTRASAPAFCWPVTTAVAPA